MRQFKEYLSEYVTGAGKIEYPYDHKEEQEAGKFIADILDIHDKSRVKSVIHPSQDMSVIVAMRNLYMGKVYGDSPKHKEHTDPDNRQNYMETISRSFPHLVEPIQAELEYVARRRKTK